MTVLDRRRLFGVRATGCAVLAGCEEKPSSDKPYRENIGVHVEWVKNALQVLRSSADDFATDNWREVVPEVQKNIADLEQAVSELENSIEPDEG